MAPKIEYVPTTGSWLSKIKAQKYGKLLFRGAQDKDGLQDYEIVDMARDPDSPLHEEFEWDDTIAGEAHRRAQARRLVRAISVKVIQRERNTTREVTVRALHHTTRNGRGSYRTVDAISSDEALRAEVIQAAYDMLLTWQARYETYAELGDIAKALKRLGLPERASKARKRA